MVKKKLTRKQAEFALKLKALRLGLKGDPRLEGKFPSQGRVAKLGKLYMRSLVAWETGEFEPSWENMKKLAKLYKIDLSTLL